MVRSSRGYKVNDEEVTLNPIVSCVSSEGKPGTVESMRRTGGGGRVFRENEADKRRRACLLFLCGAYSCSHNNGPIPLPLFSRSHPPPRTAPLGSRVATQEFGSTQSCNNFKPLHL